MPGAPFVAMPVLLVASCSYVHPGFSSKDLLCSLFPSTGGGQQRTSVCQSGTGDDGGGDRFLVSDRICLLEVLLLDMQLQLQVPRY